LCPHDPWAADDAIKDIFLDDGAEPQRVGLVGEALARDAGTDDLRYLHRRNTQVTIPRRISATNESNAGRFWAA
jgi:hypothetical protein